LSPPLPNFRIFVPKDFRNAFCVAGVSLDSPGLSRRRCCRPGLFYCRRVKQTQKERDKQITKFISIT